MKVKKRKSSIKRIRMCGFRKWAKTRNGRKMLSGRRGKRKGLTTT